MKIIDSFLFNNEFKLLELRLHELDKYVDYFIIAESNKTFTNNEKPCNFYDYWIYGDTDSKWHKLFEKFKKKIIYVPIAFQENSDSWNTWTMEEYQRNQIFNGVNALIEMKKIQRSDILLYSDVDEIPNLKNFKTDVHIPFKFEQNLYYYYLNNRMNEIWYGTTGTTLQLFGDIFNYSIQNMRIDLIQDKKLNNIIYNGGWHFSYCFGDNLELYKQKIGSFSHTEYDKKEFTSDDNIADSLLFNRDLYSRDKTFRISDIKELPEHIQSNLDVYHGLIK